MTTKLQGVQRTIQHSLNDEAKLWEALQAPGSSVTQFGDRHLAEGNKRVAFVGDAVLRMVLVEASYANDEYRGK